MLLLRLGPRLRVRAVDAPQEAEAPLQLLLHGSDLLGAGAAVQAGRKAGRTGLHGPELDLERLQSGRPLNKCGLLGGHQTGNTTR